MNPLLLAAVLLGAQPDASRVEAPVEIRVTEDDTRIDRSCIVVIPPGTVIADANGDGVIHIVADGITVEFAPGSRLMGARDEDGADGKGPDGRGAEGFKGFGLRLEGHKGVTIRNARISGYKVGLSASECDGLTIEGGDYSGNFRQRLQSTPQAEYGGDWLSPHHNDNKEWTTRYGAAISVARAEDVTIRDVLVRRGQNGIVIDRVNKSRVYDNDCSFLSGWGLAMWRSSGNMVSRNAFDFCVRGYSHGVYNRGQDSAGILIFEQCCDNQFIENSATHGGDGVFGFAGREALGEARPPAADGKPFDYNRRGNNDNLFLRNDLSYAPAHGLEMTFSHGNRIIQNIFRQNAICGIWGGYSRDTLIAANTFKLNGEMAYGLERGGINIEHGSGNIIVANGFVANKCGIHLWWDNDAGLLKMPGVQAGYRGVADNIIAGNLFTGEPVALQLRDDSPDKSKVVGTVFINSITQAVPKLIDAPPEIAVIQEGTTPAYETPEVTPLGRKKPVDARLRLAGRQNIIMTEWGPWDHEEPLARLVKDTGSEHVYEFYAIDPGRVKISGDLVKVETAPPSATPTLPPPHATPTGAWSATITATRAGAAPYTVEITQPGYERTLGGSLLSVSWDVTVFPWERVPGPNPPPDLDKWRASASGPQAVKAKVERLSFQFGGRGPSDVGISPEVTGAKFPSDYFGIIATTRLHLSKGKWKFITTSDDGVRLIADGKTIIENWTHHGATQDSAELVVEEDRVVDLKLEYFEIFGAAVLDLKIERIP